MLRDAPVKKCYVTLLQPPNSRPHEPTDRNRPRHKTSTPEPPHRQHDPHIFSPLLRDDLGVPPTGQAGGRSRHGAASVSWKDSAAAWLLSVSTI